MQPIDKIREANALLRAVLDEMPLHAVEESARLCIECIERGGKIMVCGNGGSAADAQHFVAELVVRYRADGKGLPAIALTTDASVLTACANDFGYAEVFARQVLALGRPGDVLIVITTSGNSPNVLEAIDASHGIGVETIALTGRSGLRLGHTAGVELRVPSGETPRIQEAHIFALHCIAELVEDACRK